MCVDQKAALSLGFRGGGGLSTETREPRAHGALYAYAYVTRDRLQSSTAGYRLESSGASWSGAAAWEAPGVLSNEQIARFRLFKIEQAIKQAVQNCSLKNGKRRKRLPAAVAAEHARAGAGPSMRTALLT